MPGVKLDEKSKTGLKRTLLTANDKVAYFWGWWCPTCSTDGKLIGQEDFRSRESARRAAAKHEARRGHR